MGENKRENKVNNIELKHTRNDIGSRWGTSWCGGGGTPLNIDYNDSFNLLMKALRHLLCAKNMQMPHEV